MKPLTFLCLASYFKGKAFLDQCYQQGVECLLVTSQDLYDKPWPSTLKERFCVPDLTQEDELMKAVCYLARNHEFDGIIALDEYMMDFAADLREHLRMPGLGVTQNRFTRDKLSMRVRGREAGLPVPGFVHLLNHSRIARFLDEVPPPWILKPRGEAGAVKMKKLHHAHEVWPVIEELGDDQPKYLLEAFIPGDILHVDSIVWDGKLIFAAPHQYYTPPFNVWHQGGVFGSMSVPPAEPLYEQVMELNKGVIKAVGLQRGVTHAEYIRAQSDGKLYFLEVAARVGGAHIDALVRGTTGVDLWREWANLEAASLRGENYKLPKTSRLVGGLLVCLSRQQEPDLSDFDAPEVVWTYSEDYHAGLVLAGKNPAKIRELMERYREQIEEDILAVAPPTDRPA